MAKWDFKIVGASFVKELVPVADDVNPRSQSFMQPSFDLEGDKIVMKESGQYVTAIYFPQIGEIDGVAPTDIDDANAKLLTLVENFNGGGAASQNLAETLAIDNKTNDIPIVSNNVKAVVDVNDDYVYISYEGNYLTLEPTNGLQLSSNTNVLTIAPDMGAIIDGTINYTCPSFLLNNEEVATQNWVTSQGESISTAKIINRCPDDAFRNAHGNLKIGDVQYYGTRTSPPELIRFPNPNDLSIFTKITLASSSFGSIEYLAYNETLGKIYACLNTNKLLVINDIADITDYDIIDITLSAGNLAASSVVMTDDAHIYIGTATGSQVARFIKLDATDYSELKNAPWIGDDSSDRLNIHSAVWSSDKSELFFCQNGGVNYMAFVSPLDMTYTELFVGNSITDDICIMEDTGSMISFSRFIFCPTEGRQLGTKGGFLVDIDMRVSYAFDALPSAGCCWDADTKILYSACIDGVIQSWTGENAVAMALGYLDPKKASEVYVDLNGNWFNEITKIDGKFFATIWNNDTSFGEDGLGALVELDLIKVRNGAISVTESLFINDRYLKSQYVGSVTSASYIDITFSNADWSTLILKDYGVSLTPNNSASGTAIVGWYMTNKLANSFRLNFASPVTADLDLTIIINP